MVDINNNPDNPIIGNRSFGENKGNVTISNITLNDILTDDNGNNLSLSRGPTFVSSNQGSSNGILKVGETASYNASYTISLEAANSGSVKNQVIATGSSPGQSNNVSDTSDDDFPSPTITIAFHIILFSFARENS